MGNPRSFSFLLPMRREARPTVHGFPMMVHAGLALWRCFKLTSRFSGLTSRWTMRRLWRYLRACTRLLIILLASLSVYLVDRAMSSNRSPPCNTHTHTRVKPGLIICIKNSSVEVITELDNWKKKPAMILLF